MFRHSDQAELDFGSATSSSSIDLGSGIDTITITAPSSNYDLGITVPNINYYNMGSMADTISTNGITWNSDYSINSSFNLSNIVLNNDGIEMQAGCDIKIGNKSLSESIEKIEERLGILTPNPELEDKWEKLKDLRKQYQDLEKEILEKEKMWKILKET